MTDPKTISTLAANPPPVAFDPTKPAPANPQWPSMRYRHAEGKARFAHLAQKFGLDLATGDRNIVNLNSQLNILDQIDREVDGDAGSPAATSSVTPQVSAPMPSATSKPTTAAITPATTATPIMNQYAAIKDTKARVEFYKNNKAAYDAEFTASRPKPEPPSNPFAASDAAIFATFNSISHAGDKVAFYRASSRAIDRHYENQ